MNSQCYSAARWNVALSITVEKIKRKSFYNWHFATRWKVVTQQALLTIFCCEKFNRIGNI